MRLLVAGADRVDAGKTTFAVGLAAHTDSLAVKPRAGNDYWFDYDDYRAAVDAGRLYGKDARRLAAVSGESPEAVNPVHRLWTPAPGEGKGLLGREGRAVLCDRVTLDGGHEYVVNGTRDLPERASDALPLDDATTVASLHEYNAVMERLHRPALDTMADRVEAADRVVVESYADIARPLTEFVPDAVAVVEPTRVRLYDGGRYANACSVASGSAREGRLEVRVGNVLELIEPTARATLAPLPDEVRSDPEAIAEANDHAYRALVATALD
ncbi:ATPase [Halomarina litorea]|uniref:ATPase n=1 Tax=Halomarina litorea TaxID=2961595 RepID=UPI0020C46539|nr:ATPase [Halomarina sp. BCD28]